jgi:hypothetical protein
LENKPVTSFAKALKKLKKSFFHEIYHYYLKIFHFKGVLGFWGFGVLGLGFRV